MRPNPQPSAIRYTSSAALGTAWSWKNQFRMRAARGPLSVMRPYNPYLSQTYHTCIVYDVVHAFQPGS